MIKCPLPTQKGFHLIEILMSVLVLSIGITAVLKLQIIALQTTQQSNFYSEAQLLTNEIAEVLNSSPVLQATTHVSPFLEVGIQTGQEATTALQNCFDASCNPEQLVAAQISEWRKKVKNTLPNARVKVCLDDSPWNTSTNNFSWDCNPHSNRSSTVIKLGWAEKSRNAAQTFPLLTLPVSSPLD